MTLFACSELSEEHNWFSAHFFKFRPSSFFQGDFRKKNLHEGSSIFLRCHYDTHAVKVEFIINCKVCFL